ncbi:hypothetical protein DSECCO2_138370 [anaerobic digester metagenome]
MIFKKKPPKPKKRRLEKRTFEEPKKRIEFKRGRRKKYRLGKGLKVILAAILIFLVGAAAFVIYEYEQPSSANTMKGEHNILLLCVDPTEDNGTEGMGSVDMAFAVYVVDGDVKNVTSIYPGGMRSSNLTEPAELGTGNMLLHDSLYGVSTEEGAQQAQEIVEYNTGIKTDAVVMITPDAVNAILAAVGPVEVNGEKQTITDSMGYIRNMTEEANSTETRGEAVHNLMDPIINATANNPVTYLNLANVAMDQYNQGNIRVVPSDLIAHFAASKGIKSIIG